MATTAGHDDSAIRQQECSRPFWGLGGLSASGRHRTGRREGTGPRVVQLGRRVGVGDAAPVPTDDEDSAVAETDGGVVRAGPDRLRSLRERPVGARCRDGDRRRRDRIEDLRLPAGDQDAAIDQAHHRTDVRLRCRGGHGERPGGGVVDLGTQRTSKIVRPARHQDPTVGQRDSRVLVATGDERSRRQEAIGGRVVQLGTRQPPGIVTAGHATDDEDSTIRQKRRGMSAASTADGPGFDAHPASRAEGAGRRVEQLRSRRAGHRCRSIHP